MNAITEIEQDERLAVSTVCACGCGKLFLKKSSKHRFFSDQCRYSSTDRINPRYIETTRARCDRWYREKNPNACRVVSLSGAPFIGVHLPGAAVVVKFASGVVPPLCSGRHMHAAITQLLEIPHEELAPTFSASPYGNGWGIYCPNIYAVRSIASIRDVIQIGQDRREIFTGPLMRLRAPVVTKRGWRRLRVDVITPVCIKSTSSKTGKTIVRQLGIADLLNGSLAGFAKLRLGLYIGDRICCEVVEHETTLESIDLGGKIGFVRGFSGYVVVRCNAVGEWLLRAAEQISVGSRVGFGFGRIRVSEFIDEKSTAVGRFFVTPHAVNRYIQRVHPSASYAQALGEIIRESAGARYVKNYRDAEYWITGRPLRLRLIVGRENAGLPQILTILPGHT